MEQALVINKSGIITSKLEIIGLDISRDLCHSFNINE